MVWSLPRHRDRASKAAQILTVAILMHCGYAFFFFTRSSSEAYHTEPERRAPRKLVYPENQLYILFIKDVVEIEGKSPESLGGAGASSTSSSSYRFHNTPKGLKMSLSDPEDPKLDSRCDEDSKARTVLFR